MIFSQDMLCVRSYASCGKKVCKGKSRNQNISEMLPAQPVRNAHKANTHIYTRTPIQILNIILLFVLCGKDLPQAK